eukprot:6994505-Karenia_brevis.AAC.1
MVADIVFMDDLISLFTFEKLDEVREFVLMVVEVFEMWQFKVNYRKLEIVLAVRGDGSASIVDALRSGQISWDIHGITVTAKESA